MVFSNLAGTTSNKFSITKVPITNGTTYGENGILLSGNTYDLFWNMSGILGEEYMNKSVIFIHKEGITDLNSCGHPGQYVCSWTYLSKLANIPEELRDTTNNFIMISHPVDTSNYDWGAVSVYSQAVQELTTSKGKRYFRTKSNQNWTAWQRVAFTSEIPVMPALHAVATSGDYNTLINKPNVSSGPTVETGTFKLSSNAVDIIQDTPHQYVKYGNLCFVNLDFSFKAKSPSALIGIGGLPFNSTGLIRAQPLHMYADIAPTPEGYDSAIYVVPRFYTNNAFVLFSVVFYQVGNFINWRELYSDEIGVNSQCDIKGSFVYPCQ